MVAPDILRSIPFPNVPLSQWVEGGRKAVASGGRELVRTVVGELDPKNYSKRASIIGVLLLVAAPLVPGNREDLKIGATWTSFRQSIGMYTEQEIDEQYHRALYEYAANYKSIFRQDHPSKKVYMTPSAGEETLRPVVQVHPKLEPTQTPDSIDMARQLRSPAAR